MKKIYLTLMFFAIVGLLSAQQVERVNSAIQKTEVGGISQAEFQVKAELIQKNFALRTNNSKSVESRWYNAAFTIEDVMESAKASARSIFPDTTILMEYISGAFPVQYHSVGECVDPTSAWYQDPTQLTINKYTPYTVDSIGIYCLYKRNLDVVDTLLIQVRASDGGYLLYTGWTEGDYGVDSLKVRPVPFDADLNYSTDAGITTIKVPLTAAIYADTMSNGILYIAAGPSTPVAIPAGQEAIVTYSFIPGYSWNANTDTLASKNSFSFISYEENGENSYPLYTKGDFTASYALRSIEMYDASKTSYANAFAFYEDWKYEHHWIELKLSADASSIGINNSNVNNLNVSQNRPNPFNGNTTISYNLTETSKVNVTIYNVAGAKVMDLNQGTQSAGSHNLNIDGSSLQAGVYFYTFTADNHSVTKKMIVY